jgi:hypothetical protein
LGLFGARVLAARLADFTRSALHPCTPHLRRELSKCRGSFPFSPLTKTTTSAKNGARQANNEIYTPYFIASASVDNFRAALMTTGPIAFKISCL